MVMMMMMMMMMMTQILQRQGYEAKVPNVLG